MLKARNILLPILLLAVIFSLVMFSPQSITAQAASHSEPTSPAALSQTTEIQSPVPIQAPEDFNSTLRLVIFLGIGLVVLTIIMVIVIIYVLRKFKNI